MTLLPASRCNDSGAGLVFFFLDNAKTGNSKLAARFYFDRYAYRNTTPAPSSATSARARCRLLTTSCASMACAGSCATFGTLAPFLDDVHYVDFAANFHRLR